LGQTLSEKFSEKNFTQRQWGRNGAGHGGGSGKKKALKDSRNKPKRGKNVMGPPAKAQGAFRRKSE